MTHASANEMARKQGWTLRTLCDVLLDYIANQGDDATFTGYLRERAASENRASGGSVRQVSTVTDIGDFNPQSR